jgi:hypothetical protein
MKDERRFMSMLEDYWLPRREGSQGTSIETLPGGENLGEMQDVEYFQKKVYRSLNVPLSRLDSNSGFQLGRAAEISRDEVKFAKFIHRIRLRFSHLFDELLKKQLILKNIISIDEWQQIRESIRYTYNTDNHFAELKESEIIKSRLELLSSLDSFAGKYYSVKWIRQNVLRQTEEEQEQIDSQIKEEQTKYGTGVDGDTSNQNSNSETPSIDENRGDSDTVTELYDPMFDLDLDN